MSLVDLDILITFETFVNLRRFLVFVSFVTLTVAAQHFWLNPTQCTLKLDRREGGPELIIMFSDYDTTASKLSCDEIPLVQSFQPIGNELTFCVL